MSNSNTKIRFISDFQEIRQRLARALANYKQSGTVLSLDELNDLYRHRLRLKPGKLESQLILASMIMIPDPDARNFTIDVRRNELGWFWFRHYTRKQFANILLALIESPNRLVRLPAIGLLPHVDRKSGLLKLVELTGDSDPEIGEAAVLAIGKYPAASALPILRHIATDRAKPDFLRGRTVYGIGRLKSPEDLELIRNLAADPCADVRCEVVNALSQIRNPEDAALVRKLLNDPHEYVRRRATHVICKFGQQADRLWLRSISLNKKHIDRLVAVKSLATYKNMEDRPLFRKLAADDNWMVRQSAYAFLGHFQHHDDLEILVKGVFDPEIPAFSALLQFPSKTIVPIIKRLAKRPENDFLISLAASLGSFHHLEAFKILRRLAQAKEWRIREYVAQSLGGLANPQDLPRLRHMSNFDTESVRKQAVWAIAKFSNKNDVEFFKERLHDESGEVRRFAAFALIKLMSRRELLKLLPKCLNLHCPKLLIEFDFAIYAPDWLKKAKPRIGETKSLLCANEWQPTPLTTNYELEF